MKRAKTYAKNYVAYLTFSLNRLMLYQQNCAFFLLNVKREGFIT